MLRLTLFYTCMLHFHITYSDDAFDTIIFIGCHCTYSWRWKKNITDIAYYACVNAWTQNSNSLWQNMHHLVIAVTILCYRLSVWRCTVFLLLYAASRTDNPVSFSTQEVRAAEVEEDDTADNVLTDVTTEFGWLSDMSLLCDDYLVGLTCTVAVTKTQPFSRRVNVHYNRQYCN